MMTLEKGPFKPKERKLKLSFIFLGKSKALLSKTSRFTAPLKEAQFCQQPLQVPQESERISDRTSAVQIT